MPVSACLVLERLVCWWCDLGSVTSSFLARQDFRRGVVTVNVMKMAVWAAETWEKQVGMVVVNSRYSMGPVHVEERWQMRI